MTAVAGIVCCSFIGRRWAGTKPAPTVAARGLEHRSLSQPFNMSTTVGHTVGGVAGGIPPHRTAVVSGQWSETTALALLGAGTGYWRGGMRLDLSCQHYDIDRMQHMPYTFKFRVSIDWLGSV